MSAVLAEVSDAVVTELNSRPDSWPLTFTSKRMNVPKFKREEFNNLQVVVSPKSRKTTPATRGQYYENVQVYVFIQKGLSGETNAESDSLIDLGETIADYFANGRSLASYPGAPCVGAEFGDSTPFMDTQTESDGLLYKGVAILEFQSLRTPV